jgi:DNA-binding LacI/PurR family transcriptional regulator
MRSLLADRSFTAAFVASDNVAIGAKAALREAGLRIPENISLVGFDDIPWAQYSDPPLTTIRLPAQRLADELCHPDGSPSGQGTPDTKAHPEYGTHCTQVLS